MKRGKAAPCRGHSKCEGFEAGYAWSGYESWGQCSWSRVSWGRGAEGEVRAAEGVHRARGT